MSVFFYTIYIRNRFVKIKKLYNNKIIEIGINLLKPIAIVKNLDKKIKMNFKLLNCFLK